MSDFYSDPAAPVLVRRFGPPANITVGEDGIPDYVTATSGSPHQYIAPAGYRLAIYHNGTRVGHIVEADRKRGFAVGRHYRVKGWDLEFLPTDEHGQSQHRFYQGQIAFRLILAARMYTPPEMRSGVVGVPVGRKVFGFYGG